MAARTHIEVVMPQMGVSVSEGTIVKWLVREGEATAADEPLLEISTDKVDTEVPSPADGILERIVKLEGETVAVGTTLALIVPAGEGEIPAEDVEPTAPEVETETAVVPAAPPSEPSREQSRAFVSPVVARIAAEHRVDLGSIAGSGQGGRVTKKDILAHLESGRATGKDRPEPAPAPKPPTQAGPIGDQLEPMSQMRRTIAEHMRRSLDTAAHATTVFEVDMSRVVAIRERFKPDFLHRHGVRLTYLSFVARATVEALRNWPWLNAEIRRNEEIVTHSYINLSIAVAVDGGKGLVVPVIRNAEGLNLLGMARAIQDIGDRARSKRLLPEDVQSGTFTITNPGGQGSIVGTPIINQPQVAILDTEALVKRPVVITDDNGADAISIRPMMNLCLSFDHRLVDGAYAVQFMAEVRANLESWGEERY